MILHARFYGVAKYWNLQVLTKISSKIKFLIAMGHYIIVIFIFTMEICNKKFLINSKCFILQNCAQGFSQSHGQIILLTYFQTLNRTEKKTSLPKVCKPSTVQNYSQLVHYELCYTFYVCSCFHSLQLFENYWSHCYKIDLLLI